MDRDVAARDARRRAAGFGPAERTLIALAAAVIATTIVIVVAYAVLAGIGLLVVFAAGQFTALVAGDPGALDRARDALQTCMTGLGFAPATAASSTGWLDPHVLIQAAVAIGDAVLHAAIAFFFVLAYILFMAVDAAGTTSIVERFQRSKAHVIAALTDCARGTRSYLLVNSVFGVVVALLDGVVLLVLQVPGTLVWVVLAFVTNYIPRIGFVIGVIPPAVIAFVTGGRGPA